MFDINADIQGVGWQQYRGRLALANGGFFGQGYLKGTLTQMGKAGVPEGHNDFIFVTIGEELGFFGCFCVLVLLVLEGREGRSWIEVERQRHGLSS